MREHALNAGVEINGYAPVTFEELLENNARQKALSKEQKVKQRAVFMETKKEETK